MSLPRLASAALRTFRRNRRAAVRRTIPSNAACAELGVWKDDFSERIRVSAGPRALHLIGPWRFVAEHAPRTATVDGDQFILRL